MTDVVADAVAAHRAAHGYSSPPSRHFAGCTCGWFNKEPLQSEESADAIQAAHAADAIRTTLTTSRLTSEDRPPVAKYTLTLTITGNSHDELANELHYQAHGTHLLNSDYGNRDTYTVYGGRYTGRLEHTNPDMTPERYAAELDAWAKRRSAGGAS